MCTPHAHVVIEHYNHSGKEPKRSWSYSLISKGPTVDKSSKLVASQGQGTIGGKHQM